MSVASFEYEEDGLYARNQLTSDFDGVLIGGCERRSQSKLSFAFVAVVMEEGT